MTQQNLSMFTFSNHVLSLANKEMGGISNLQLHKVMYFALGNYIKDFGIDSFIRNIYDEPFEAWPYGPVIRSEYFRNRIFGRYYIGNPGIYNTDMEILNDYILSFLSRNVNELVEESHEHSTWIENREAILQHEKIIYTLEDLQYDFTA